MHTPIDQVRHDLLQNRVDYRQSTAFEGAHLGLLAKLGELLQRPGSNYRSIAFCWPFKEEPDLKAPLLQWQQSAPQRSLLLPKVRSDKRLDFYTWSESYALITNAYGILEPNPESPGIELAQPDCILIPCVGWSHQKDCLWRLGYGGGYFDRTIATLKNEGHTFKTIGVAYDWQKLSADRWVPQDHDQALDYMVTNSMIYPK